MKKNKNDILAGIDVGSHALRMKIVQVKEDGKIKILELLRQPISLGKETYTLGKISFKAIAETCKILKGFKQLMKEYQVKTYQAVATSAIREADNKEYIVDQIKLKTGLNLRVIDNAEERFLTYKSIRENLKNHQKLRKEGILIVDIGSGSIEISGYEKNLLFSQNIKLGSLRLRELLSSIEGRTLDFPKILEEYIHSNINHLKDLYFHQSFSNFIALGGEIRVIAELCNKNPEEKYIEKETFDKLYENILYMPVDQIVQTYNIPYHRADILVPSMIIFKKFLDMTKGKGIYVPLVSLRDGIISDLIDQRFETKRSLDFDQDIVTSVRNLAKRYLYDQSHAEYVENTALFLFDALQKLHGLGNRERLLLKLSSILHDIGKFINIRKHYNHSYAIIKGSNFIGISKTELKMVANIARYHSSLTPNYNHKSFLSLHEKNRVIVSKLVGIIRLADALDHSHQQKIDALQVSLKEKEVIITGNATQNTLLEEWTFGLKSEFFQEVFGMKPILKIKRTIENEF